MTPPSSDCFPFSSSASWRTAQGRVQLINFGRSMATLDRDADAPRDDFLPGDLYFSQARRTNLFAALMRPLVHELAPLVEQIAPAICCFDLVTDGVGECHFSHLAWKVG